SMAASTSASRRASASSTDSWARSNFPSKRNANGGPPPPRSREQRANAAPTRHQRAPSNLGQRWARTNPARPSHPRLTRSVCGQPAAASTSSTNATSSKANTSILFLPLPVARREERERLVRLLAEARQVAARLLEVVVDRPLRRRGDGPTAPRVPRADDQGRRLAADRGERVAERAVLGLGERPIREFHPSAPGPDRGA